MATAVQTVHLLRQHLWVPPVPTVANDQDDRPLPANAPRPVEIERAHRLADSRASCPIIDCAGSLLQRQVDVSPPQVARNSSQPRAEDECLHPVQRVGDREKELQQDAAVAVHRAADVGQGDDRAPCGFPLAPRDHQGLPTVTDILTHRSPQIHQVAVRRGYATARPSFRRRPLQLLHELLYLLQFVLCHRGEVPTPQGLRATVGVDLLDVRFLLEVLSVVLSLPVCLDEPILYLALRRLLQQFTQIEARKLLLFPGPPEEFECLVEQLEMFLAIDQNGPSRVARLRFHPQVDLRKRFNQVQNLCRRHRDAQAAQETGEQQEILEEIPACGTVRRRVNCGLHLHYSANAADLRRT